MTASGLGLEEALAKTDFIPQFFGLRPYVYSFGGFKLCRSTWRTAYTVTIVLLMSLSLVMFIQRDMENTYTTGYRNKVNIMKHVVDSSTGIITLIASVTSINDKNNALEALKSSGITFITPRRSISLLLMVMCIIIFIINFQKSGSVTVMELLWNFPYYGLICTACVNQFVETLTILQDAFRQMQEWVLEKPRPRLDVAVSSFHRVTTAAEHYNEAFGVQLLAIVGSNFLFATTNAFLLVVENDLFTRALEILWFSASAIIILRIVCAIDNLLQQRNEFNETLNTLLSRGHEFTNAAESAKVKLHVSMKKDLQFTARGFFSLDYGLIQSMLSAVTTYLVILMQFNQ